MKCPKCQFFGFDGQTRCRHCGYDLSLAATVDVGPEGAAGRAPADDGGAPPAADIAYRPEPSARAQARAAIQKRAASRTPPAESFDLPLFATPGVDDRPALPASRPPLSVRRPVSDAPRARAAAAAAFAPAPAPAPADAPAMTLAVDLPASPDADTEPALAAPLDLDAMRSPAPAWTDVDPMTLGGTPLVGELRASGGALTLPGREASLSASAGFARAHREPVELPAIEPAAHEPEPDTAIAIATAADAGDDSRLAPLGRRMLAGLIDVAGLAVVDAIVIVATLRATGVELAQFERLPVAPLAVFLLLLAIGYLALCTVLAGRTFGKSLLGLAVVEAGGRPIRLAPAVVRALLQVVTLAAGGLGFLPALLGADRRALYDRLAGTEVIRDPAAAVQPE